MFPTLVTGNMEEYVTDAKTFKPARWLKDFGNENLHPFASLPYGYGARMCLGRRFADLEMQVLLAKVQYFIYVTLNVYNNTCLNMSLYFAPFESLRPRMRVVLENISSSLDNFIVFCR